MKTIFDVLAILAAAIVNLISGPTLISIGRAHTRLFSEMDVELPSISKACAAYTATFVPVVVGMTLGLTTLVGLFLVFRSERLYWLLPFLLSISFIESILHIMFVVFGVTLPLVVLSPTP